MTELPIDQIINGSTLDVLRDMPSESIDCVITSVPYWGLRSYGTEPQVWGGLDSCEHVWGNNITVKTGRNDAERLDEIGGASGHGGGNHTSIQYGTHNTCINCGAWRGELGLEPTFQLYIEHLQTIFDEVWRVLKKSGTCWVNMGDSYWGGGRGEDKKRGVNRLKLGLYDSVPSGNNNPARGKALLDKSLCNIPHRFAISMTDNNWIERNCIIWHKPSCMPSSAKDRFTVDFEYVFFFTKNKKYYFEQQFEAQSDNPETQARHKRGNEKVLAKKVREHPEQIATNAQAMKLAYNSDTWKRILPNGRNRRAVWTIEKDYTGEAIKDYESAGAQNASDVKRRTLKYMKDNPYGSANKRAVWRINPQPFKDAHFAVFPEKLVEPMIRAGCPSAICDSCGKPYERDLTHKSLERYELGKDDPRYRPARYYGANTYQHGKQGMRYCEVTDNGIKKCNCNAPTHAGIVLDPFSGSGTTCLVARKLGRHYIGIDLQPEYCNMARKRLAEVL